MACMLDRPCAAQAQANLKQQIEALESEKKLMQTKAVTDRDIVDLNVGGTVLSTMRSTLTQVTYSPTSFADLRND